MMGSRFLLEGTTMDSVAVTTNGAEGTGTVAAILARYLGPGDAVLLKGGLATGKTTFVKAVAAAMGSQSVVTSPTFMLAQFYPTERSTILHIDAYRLSGIHEYRDLGLDDYLDDSVTLAEWGEKIAQDFPCHLMVEFQCDPSAPDVRVLAFTSGCPRWASVINAMQTGLMDAAKLS
jgi:tRNA threonylcarbamoyladenosine biosynthesis protein TsaE